MARKIRIQFEGAIYHVINRGNYRRDIFESASTAKAFEQTLDEACERHKWRLHGYVIMRNHYHLAVETPVANLVDGMHWLQSTFATRFNRFRSEHGHLFQGRYQALLVEDVTALVRVVNYIHLNPIRAGVVTFEQLAGFRWSSLVRFMRHSRPQWLASDWLQQLGRVDSPDGWASYLEYLRELSGDPVAQEAQDFAQLSRGWAVGTAGWRKAIAGDLAHFALSSEISAGELQEIRETRWAESLSRILAAAGKTPNDVNRDPKGAKWKILCARRLRVEAGAPHPWIAKALAMGSPNSLRSYLSRQNTETTNQQTSA